MLINDFMEYFHLKLGIMFFCKDLPYPIGDYYMSYIPIETFNVNESLNILHFDHRTLGIVFDINCERTKEIFEVFSINNFFNRSYNWLMFAENLEHASESLEKENINIDAEITLAIPSENDSGVLKLYDVYNPCFKRGGILNLTNKGIWSKINGLEITLTQSKIDRRSNLNKLTLHAGVVITGIMPNQTILEYMESNDNMEFDSQHVTLYNF